jgi:meiotically up-regulated gene 157 (Mug157) protein
MSGWNLPPGVTTQMIEHACGGDIDENEWQRVAEELAQSDFDDMTVNAQDFLTENAADYIIALARGGDIAAERLRDMERDCVSYLAEMMDDDRIRDAMETTEEV